MNVMDKDTGETNRVEAILALNPYAWYSAEYGQPKNKGYVQLNGVQYDDISTPHSATLNVTTAIEFVCRIKAVDYTPSSIQTIASKYDTSNNNRSYLLRLLTSGAIQITGSIDGTGTNIVNGSVTPGAGIFVDNTWYWIRVRWNQTTGYSVEYAADQAEEPSTWTLIGTSATNAPTYFSSTASLRIGSFTNGTLEPFNGQISRVIIRSSYDGPKIADFDARKCFLDGYYDRALSIAWTINNPKIYDRSANNRAPVSFAAGSNKPQALTYDGDAYINTDTTSNNYVVSDRAHDLSGTFKAVARIFYHSGMNTSTPLIGDRAGASGAGVFRIGSPTTNLNLLWYEGTSPVQTSRGHSIPENTKAWVGCERINNINGVWRVTFYRSFQNDPDLNSWDGWENLGYNEAAVPAAPTPSSNALRIGDNITSMSTKLYRAMVWNNGVLKGDVNPQLFTSTDYTDPVGNVWSFNRPTSGHKLSLISPAAHSGRARVRTGVDDYVTGPAAAIPPATIGTESTIFVVGKDWPTPLTGGSIFDTRASNTVTPGIGLRRKGTTNEVDVTLTSATVVVTSGSLVASHGVRHLMGAYIDATNFGPIVDRTFGPGSARTGADETGLGPLILATRPNFTSYIEQEFEELLTFNKKLSQAELDKLNDLFATGV